jgi:hypothetical protein
MARKKLILKPQPVVVQQPAKPPVMVSSETFDQWWTKYQGKNGYSPNLKLPVEIHMKARGFWKTRNWVAGIKDFGHK